MTFILLFSQCVCYIGLVFLLASYFGGIIKRLRHQRNSLYESLYGVKYEARFSEEWIREEVGLEFAKLSAAVEVLPPVMSLLIDEQSDSVELLLDTKRDFYDDWFEGGDRHICLYRDRETKRVVGCCLPLYQRELRVTRFKKTKNRSRHA